MPKEDELLTRVMSEILPKGKISIDDGAIAAGTFLDGYVVADAVSLTTVSSLNNYFDLSGYTIRDLTTYIQAVIFQKIGPYGLSGMQSDNVIEEHILVTTTPLSLDDDFSLLTPSGMRTVPGSLTSKTRLSSVVQATTISYDQDTGAGFGRVMDVSTWGVGNSTAAERLYYHRVLIFPKVNNAGNSTYFFEFPELGFVVPIVVDKEPELEYMMRLSRSLEPVY